MNQSERLAEYRRKTSPLASVFDHVQSLKGDKGDSPTEQELIRLIKPLIPTPIKGEDGDTPTEEQLDSIIKPLIPKPLKGDPGKAGYTPVRGVDYWTKEDVSEIVQNVLSLIPKSKSPPNAVEIAREMKKHPVKYSDIMDAPDLTDLPKLIQFLKMGGFRGGGSSTGPGGATPFAETVTGTINSSNRIFTVPTTIVTAQALYLANSVYQPVVDFTTSGTTITMTIAPDISLAGQPFWLLHT